MNPRFGTDGIRGDADEVLRPEVVAALGRAAARVLGRDRPFLVGRDTRASGPRIEADLVRGLAAEGVEARVTGVVPTPAVAFLAGEDDAPSAMISASHNRWSDNGIKLFARGGRKLPDDVEAAVERELGGLLAASDPLPRAVVPTEEPEAAERYVAHLVAALEGRRLEGLRVVLDCANGAASVVGPRALRELGAEVIAVHASPDGRNINDGCGSTHPDAVSSAVAEHGADAGLALDGDADRVVAVDAGGALVDGDQIMVVAALDLRERGRLPGDAVAVTVMSNLGLRRALEGAGIRVVETGVGDRQVLAAMEREGIALGGEQSGHVIFGDLATTGDGLLTATMLLDRVARSGCPLSQLAGAMVRLPQVLENVRFEHRVDLAGAAAVWDAVRAEEEALGTDGRVLLRASGTEPLVRIMVEAPSEHDARAVASRLRAVVVAELGRRGSRAGGASR